MRSLMLFARTFARRFTSRFLATNCWEVAGGLAFTTLLAMVPMATLTLLFFRSLPAFAELGEVLREFLTANLLPQAAAAIITQYTEAFTANAGQLTALGSTLLLFSALLLLITVEDVFNRIWNARRSRSWARRLTLYWFVLTAGPLLVGGSIVAARTLASEASAFAGHTTWSGTVAALLIPLLLLWLFFAFLYFSVPHHPVRGRIAAIAGLAVALLFLLLQRSFSWFITTIPTYTLIYGAFAALPIFLLWLYSIWLLILCGAVAVAAFEETDAEIRSLPHFPGYEALAAMTLMETLWQAQKQGYGVDQETLWRAARLPPYECERLLEQLRELGWAERSEKGTWFAAIAPTALSPAAVLAHFALDLDQWRRYAATATARRIPEQMAPAIAALAESFAVATPTEARFSTGPSTPEAIEQPLPPTSALPASAAPQRLLPKPLAEPPHSPQ